MGTNRGSRRVFYALLSAFAVLAFSSAVGTFADDAKDAKDSESKQSFVVQVEEKNAEIEFVKIGEEPAVATIRVPGEKDVVFDAYEPIESAPEFARKPITEAWEKLGEIPKKKIKVEIDTTQAPDAEDWAKRVQSRVEYWYPKVVEMLDGEEGLNKIPDDFKIRLVFKPFNGVAYAAGREITVSSTYIKSRPNDYGLVIHETTHVAQAYRRVRETWAMEGMTDYIRYFVTEPRSKNTWRIDPKRSKYTDSYGVTATFYDWIIREKDPQFLHKIHNVFRSGQSVETFCQNEYDKPMSALWDEFVASLTTQTKQED